MAKFSDGVGREWELAITFGHIGPLKRDAGLDLERPNTDAFMNVLYSSPFGLVNAVWVLIQKQAATLTKDDWLESMGSEALDAAGDALMEALVDFIHRRRSASVKAKLPELMAAVDKAHAKAADAAMTSALKKLAGDSPESSASIPAS